jgi:trehalose 6-phosphate synthase
MASVDRVNRRFGSERCRPVILLEAHHEPAEVYQYLKAADVCYVGSLHDGMNLVAKEFVAARHDERGVLLLSRSAGAARELTEALLVNPLDIDGSARLLAQALTMPGEEQARRMRAMRAVVSRSNASRWIERILRDASRHRAGRRHVELPRAAAHADAAPA